MSVKITILAVFVFLILLFSVVFIRDTKIEKEDGKKDVFLSLQELINEAKAEDIIHVSDGIYYETIIINKPITLIGCEKEKTIIDGEGAENIIHITCDGVKLINFTIRNSGGYKQNSGVKINSDNNEIVNCEIYRTKTGLYIEKSKNNIISNCLFHTNGDGIYSSSSEGNLIKNCQFTHNSFGINIKDSKDEKIYNSYAHTNGIGIYARDSLDVEIYNSAICDNNQDGGGIWFFNCENLKIDNCNINHNGAGIKLDETDSQILNSTLNWNMYNTIKLKNVENTIIQNCNIQNSYRAAIFLGGSKILLNNNNIINSGLHSLEIDKNSFCNAKNNYWGSKKGPSYFAFNSGEKISFKPLKIKTVPYEKNIIENIGCDWKVEQRFSKEEIENDFFTNITFTQKDTDGDGVPDSWEEKWGYNPYVQEEHNTLDPDKDALNNIQECYTEKYGSNPFYKDVFIEIDYSNGNKPSAEVINNAKEIFKEHEINLHIDTGNLDGGEEIPIKNVESCEEFRDIYWDYFLHNDMDNPRKGIFRYAVVVDTIEEIWAGFVFVGWDHLDTVGISIQPIESKRFYNSKDRLIIGGITHELGHLMGLIIDDHGGIDNTGASTPFTIEWLKYSNYKSCLNYRYVYDMLGYSDGSHGKNDFDDWNNLDFYFFKNTDFDFTEGS